VWELTRKIVIHRTNGRCECCGSNVDLQIDHCFTRKCREIFYDLANLSCLCQRCHFEKSYHLRTRDLDVYAVVASREGETVFQRLMLVSRAHKPFPDFNKRWYLEQKLTEMESLLCAMEKIVNPMSTKEA